MGKGKRQGQPEWHLKASLMGCWTVAERGEAGVAEGQKQNIKGRGEAKGHGGEEVASRPRQVFRP